MKDIFIGDIRKYRENEIIEYESKGYLVLDKAKYTLNDSISIKIGKNEYSFGIRVNINEVYFFLLHNGSQIYLSIYEIYELLWKLVVCDKKIYVISALNFYVKSDDRASFMYKNKIYTVHNLPQIPDLNSDRIMIPHTDLKITVGELILLVYLIQDKSNCFEAMSKNSKYQNGLIRLYKVLLRCNEENVILVVFLF